jgi:hypothetical protein
MRLKIKMKERKFKIILKTRKFRITESIDEIKDYKGEKVEACKTAGFLINVQPTCRKPCRKEN